MRSVLSGPLASPPVVPQSWTPPRHRGRETSSAMSDAKKAT
ncbi:hypothetical protein KEM60_01205 [Austwickia sp. TVS 96-490-7B]|nr:hypothetical protein [Austwickia sp. TVS 96-490-7B]